MDEISRYAVGVDVGTSSVRTVVASVAKDGELNIVGFSEMPNSGMRKGTVANLNGPAQAIDEAVLAAERMSGYKVKAATYSINGSQVISRRMDGMIAVTTSDHVIDRSVLERVEDVALQGGVPANQQILKVVPLQFILDNQRGIKDPLGMTGSKLEMQANVISTLAPNFDNLMKVAEILDIKPEMIMPSVVASGRAVLTEKQMENGVAVIDMGATTTGVAIYEEGELQYVGVVPLGSNNITNDLAMVLAVNTEVAEELKRRFATGNFGESDKPVVIKWRGEEMQFAREQVDAVVRARLLEIFGLIKQELWQAHYERKLPEGVVLTGGGARMRGLGKFVREALEMSVKIGKPMEMKGVGSEIYVPEYAAAVGLMLFSAEHCLQNDGKEQEKKSNKAKKPGFFQKIFGKT